MARYLTAIIYTREPQINGRQFLKYRNIPTWEPKKSEFLAFAAKFPTAEHVNFYEKDTKKFVERIYLE